MVQEWDFFPSPPSSLWINPPKASNLLDLPGYVSRLMNGFKNPPGTLTIANRIKMDSCFSQGSGKIYIRL
jgi:hypothetical protein